LKLLALETSSEACSAALYCDGAISEQFEIAPRGHGKLILSMIDAVLADAGISKSQLDGVGFGRGPGAFTGVRIATSVAQGIAFGLDVEVAPVSSLAALAQGVYRRSGQQQVAAIFDARMGEVYWGQYRLNETGCMAALVDERVCAPDAIDLQGLEDPCFGAGSAWQVFSDELTRIYGERLLGMDTECRAQAQDVCTLAVDVFNRGQQVAPELALPVYLRDNVVNS